MVMNLRFQADGSYSSDIKQICDKIRSNGARPTLEEIYLIFDKKQTVRFYMNLAFSSNPVGGAINGSLYIAAFANGTGIWKFNIGEIGVDFPPGTIELPITGSYSSLEYNNDSSAITNDILRNSVEEVAKYRGGELTTPISKSLARLIIATSEAIRILEVKDCISSILGGKIGVAPNWDKIHSWGGRTLSS
jgi:hypothetical protein